MLKLAGEIAGQKNADGKESNNSEGGKGKSVEDAKQSEWGKDMVLLGVMIESLNCYNDVAFVVKSLWNYQSYYGECSIVLNAMPPCIALRRQLS